MSEDEFISYIRNLKGEDTGTLAKYRRACGEHWASRAPQHAAFQECRVRLAADFLALGLAAQYRSETIKKSGLPSNKEPQERAYWPFEHEGNVGTTWAAYCKKREPEDDPHVFYRQRQKALAEGRPTASIPSIHERFRTLLDAELELDGTGELAYRLRGLVSMLVAADIPMDVIQLAYDLRAWRSTSRHVQERWAKAFYAPSYARAGAAGEPWIDPGEVTASEDQEEDADDAD